MKKTKNKIIWAVLLGWGFGGFISFSIVTVLPIAIVKLLWIITSIFTISSWTFKPSNEETSKIIEENVEALPLKDLNNLLIKLFTVSSIFSMAILTIPVWVIVQLL